MKKSIQILMIIAVVFLSACQGPWASEPETIKTTSAPENEISEKVTLANPASQYCVSLNGKLEFRDNKAGQYGVCYFEDNRQCEEWALFRGDCPEGGLKVTGYENDAQIYCVITGGEVEGMGTNNVLCKRVDGTLCSVEANFNGECPDPNDKEPSAGNSETQ